MPSATACRLSRLSSTTLSTTRQGTTGRRGATPISLPTALARHRHRFPAQDAAGPGAVARVALVVQGSRGSPASQHVDALARPQPGPAARPAVAEGRVSGVAGVEVGDANAAPIDNHRARLAAAAASPRGCGPCQVPIGCRRHVSPPWHRFRRNSAKGTDESSASSPTWAGKPSSCVRHESPGTASAAASVRVH